MSSVIEQYIIPPELYTHTVDFEVMSQRKQNEDLKFFWELGDEWLPHGPDSNNPQPRT